MNNLSCGDGRLLVEASYPHKRSNTSSHCKLQVGNVEGKREHFQNLHAQNKVQTMVDHSSRPLSLLSTCSTSYSVQNQIFDTCGFLEITLLYIKPAKFTLVTVKPRELKQMICESQTMRLLITEKRNFNSILVVDDYCYSTTTEIADPA